jgi:ADP-heptose:LPS heptosyltransferase
MLVFWNVDSFMGLGYHFSPLRIFFARALEAFFAPFALFLRRCRSGNVRRVLLLEPFVLGDAVLMAVMLAPLKKKFPGVEIHLLVQPGSVGLFKHDSRVTRSHGVVFPWSRRRSKVGLLQSWIEMVRCIFSLRSLRFDIGFDTRGEVRSQILMLLLGCRRRVGSTNYLCSNMKIRGRLLTDSIGNPPLKHRAQLNMDLCAAIGCEMDRQRFLPALEWPAAAPHDAFTILIHTGAGWKFRMWTEEKWIALIQRIATELRLKIRVAGAPDEQPRLDIMKRRIPEDTATFITTALDELISEIGACDLLIALDSGPMNIASMLGKPVIALFGPGVVTMYEPLSPGSRVVHHQREFECAPCAQRICIHPTNNCVASITVHEVFGHVRELAVAARRPT